MPTDYIVQQGDCISSIAFRFGFFEDTVWYQEANAELRRRRPDPNVLRPGDVVSIPDLSLKQESAETHQRHRFRRKGVPVILDIELYEEEEPRADLPFTLIVDGQHVEGTTDGEGRIRIGISPGARQAEIRFENDAPIFLELGGMDPDDTVEGMQARLQNLGFYGGRHDDEVGPLTESAIREYQTQSGLDETGELDSDTIERIREEHGS